MSRSKELKRQYRRVIFTAIALAAGIHGAVFLANPSFFIAAPEKPVVRSRLDLVFGPPKIIAVDGEAALEADSLLSFEIQTHPARVALVKDWPSVYRAYTVGGSASLDLRLDSIGRVVSASLTESSGDPKKDLAFEAMALRFRYRWTPRDAVSASVRIIQPISVEQAPYPFSIRMDPPEG